jgi:phage terminase small subunit
MPRKSAAALAIVPRVSGAPARLRPPSHLGEQEVEVFRELVAACDPAHFVASDLPLLASYAEATVLARQAAKELSTDGAVIGGRTSPWLVVQEKAVRAQIALSVRLRLAPQSRLKAEAVGRRPGTATPNYIEMMRGYSDA